MVVYELFALGTKWWLEIDAPDSDAVISQLSTRITEFETAYSRFNHESLIGKLNTSHTLKNPPDELIAMLQYGLTLFQQTQGLFNMTIGAALEHHGYGLQRTGTHKHVVSHDLARDITITADQITTAPSVILDLGGFGKGWLVNQVCVLAQQLGSKHSVINGGGDIAVSSSQPVVLFVENPFNPEQSIATVQMQQGGFANSSVKKRSWKQNNIQKHHLIHPLSGEPTAHAASCHTLASDALIADTYASILLLCKPSERTALAKQAHVDYLIINEDGTYQATSPRFVMHI